MGGGISAPGVGNQCAVGINAWCYTVPGNFVSALVTNSLAHGFSATGRG